MRDPVHTYLVAAFQGSGRPGGTGLGLAIAADLVRAQGGALALVEDAATDALSGATFRISLPTPRRRQKTAAAPRPGRQTPPAG